MTFFRRTPYGEMLSGLASGSVNLAMTCSPHYREAEHLEQRSDCGDRYIECLECGARGPVADSEEEAAELWNRRDGA